MAGKTKRGKAGKATTKKSLQKPKGLKKQYLKTKPLCRVTFRLPREAAPDARSVVIVGDFNNWDRKATPLKHLKNGDWTVTINLERGRQYQYRYLIDDHIWENDWFADQYVPSPFGSDNSVVSV
ncbi:MAG: glycoside hydrolase [Nitrospirae bacterium]|nr:MAG: glycoside hydrolase [Nitrospirota bacterium]